MSVAVGLPFCGSNSPTAQASCEDSTSTALSQLLEPRLGGCAPGQLTHVGAEAFSAEVAVTMPAEASATASVREKHLTALLKWIIASTPWPSAASAIRCAIHIHVNIAAPYSLSHVL